MDIIDARSMGAVRGARSGDIDMASAEATKVVIIALVSLWSREVVQG